MIIRRAKVGDEKGIHEAHQRSIREICSADYDERQIHAWAGFDYNEDSRRQSILRAWTWVVEAQGVIKGVATLGKFMVDGEDCGDLRLFYFTPEIKGRGLGRQMLIQIEKQAQLLGWRKLILSSSLTARAFYEACGFEITGPQYDLLLSGVPVASIPMSKTLQSVQ